MTYKLGKLEPIKSNPTNLALIKTKILRGVTKYIHRKIPSIHAKCMKLILLPPD